MRERWQQIARSIRVTNEAVDAQPGLQGGCRRVEARTPTSRARTKATREVIIIGVIGGGVVVDLQHVDENQVL
jgi:hypothetical protein